jgi:hypothetical protein
VPPYGTALAANFVAAKYKHLHQTTALKRGWAAEKAIVNTKAVYAAGGGIAVAALAIFFLLGNGPKITLPSNPSPASDTPMNLTLAIKDIAVTKLDDQRARIRVTFDVTNPNRSPAILETIQYSVYVGQFRMVVGDIGESPEGMVSSQAGSFTIVGNSTTPISQPLPVPIAVRNNLTASAWDSMFTADAKFRVEGSYSSRTISRLEQTANINEFTLTFP